MTVPRPDEPVLIGSRGMYRRIARNSAFLAAGTAASALFTMLAVAIAARALHARDFGVLVLLQSSVLLLSALTSFSTQQPVIKLGSDAQVQEDRERLGTIVSMGLMVDILASILAFISAAVLIEASRGAIGLADRDVGSAWILAVSLLFTGYPTSNGIFRLYDRFGLLSLVQTICAAALFAGYAALYVAHAQLQDFVWAWAIYSAVNSALQLGLSLELVRRDRVPLSLRPRLFASTDGHTLLHYCWTTWGTSTTETIRTNGDSLMVGAIVSVEAAGLYSVARQLAGVIRKFNIVYRSTVFPEIARLASSGDIDAARKLNRRMLRAGLGTAAAAIAAAAILGPFVIPLLFGARFAPAYVPFIVMTAAAVAQLISTTPSMCVQIYRGPRLLLGLYATATLAFLAAAVALTITLSITGMAIAQLFFSIVLTLLCNSALKKVPPSPALSKKNAAVEGENW
jgi:O-antigen/teichoic acid export membrane protein